MMLLFVGCQNTTTVFSIEDTNSVSSTISDVPTTVTTTPDTMTATLATTITDEPWYDPLIDVYHVTCSPGEFASTELGISYHSATKNTFVEYTIDSDALFMNAIRIEVSGISFSSNVETVGGLRYGFEKRYLGRVVLTGLNPDTAYRFRIIHEDRESVAYLFHTAPIDTPFRFLFMTDLQVNTEDQIGITRNLIDQAYLHYDDFRFALVTGDLVETGAYSPYWDWLFESGINRIPMMVVPGNHDYLNPSASASSAAFFNAFFNHPQNGTANYLNSSYYVEYGNALFIMLDVVTGFDLVEQQAWFLSTVAAHPTDFLIVSCHFSPYGTYHESSAAAMIDNWLSIFDQTNADVVLTGHDHLYARTPRMYANSPTVIPNTGTIYFSGGSGGYKLRQVIEEESGIYEFYLVDTISTVSMITITSTDICVETIDSSGMIVDSFTVNKK